MGLFGASPSPGVAGHGFSAEHDSQSRGRHSNPCPGNPFRGQVSFLNVTPQHMANVYVYVCCVASSPAKAFQTHGKWPRIGPPGHGLWSRPLNWQSFFAECPFPATPGPGEANSRSTSHLQVFRKNKQNAILKHVYVYVVCFSPAANSRACGHGRMRSAPGPGALGGPPGGKTWEKGNKKKNKKGNIER